MEFTTVCFLLVTPLSHSYDSDLLFNVPDMAIEHIPRNVTQICGQRFYRIPIVIEYKKECFKKSFETKYVIETVGTFGNSEKSEKLEPQSRVPVFDERNSPLDKPNEAPNDAPWSVRLAKRFYTIGKDGRKRPRFEQNKCTGVLISLKHIMTTKSCFSSSERLAIFLNPPSGYDQDYYVGDSDRSGQVYRHPKQDLAIFVLKKAIDPQAIGKRTNNTRILINPVCLPKPIEKFYTGIKPATYYGWGHIGPGQEAKVLQKAEIEVMYDHFTDSNSHNFLQRGIEQNYPCLGDAGSGLVQYVDKQRSRAVLIGILKGTDLLPKGYDCTSVVTTWGIFFTRVDKNMDWVKQILKETSDL